MADIFPQHALDKANARIAALESILELAQKALEAATRDLREHDDEYHHRTREGTRGLIAECLVAIERELPDRPQPTEAE